MPDEKLVRSEKEPARCWPTPCDREGVFGILCVCGAWFPANPYDDVTEAWQQHAIERVIDVCAAWNRQEISGGKMAEILQIPASSDALRGFAYGSGSPAPPSPGDDEIALDIWYSEVPNFHPTQDDIAPIAAAVKRVRKAEARWRARSVDKEKI